MDSEQKCFLQHLQELFSRLSEQPVRAFLVDEGVYIHVQLISLAVQARCPTVLRSC